MSDPPERMASAAAIEVRKDASAFGQSSGMANRS